jgi:hypothetical protein
MVSYLDDWLIFGKKIHANSIDREITNPGLTINRDKSHIKPTAKLTYLGLDINLPRRILQATPQCIQHLLEILAILQQASSLDLRRITRYTMWLA